jgi:glycerate kinase
MSRAAWTTKSRPARVLICPDKFKGTLTATQAAGAIAQGWRRSRPADELELLPISDGGDGFGELLGWLHGARERVTRTVDAAHRPLEATWWWEPRSRTAIIESARIIGLAMLPPGRFHPCELDTFGLGEVLRAAARLRPRRTLVGVGGSATNDAGFGLARSLGWTFQDRAGKHLTRWTQLGDLERLVAPAKRCKLGDLIVAVDVRNRLLGVHGCTRVYGPQKSIRPEDIAPAERCLRRLARVVGHAWRSRPRPASLPGAGAAGGLGFGLVAFAGARIEPGFEFFARFVGLAKRIAAADLVITGEGALDETTLSMGKGVGGLARLCRRRRRPCLALGGVVQARERAERRFTGVHALAPDLTSIEDAKHRAAQWLAELARRVAAAWAA